MADQTLKVLFQLQDQMSGPLSNITSALGALQKLAVSVGAALGVAFGLRALVQLGKDAIGAAEHITSLARQTGISTTNIQKLGVASEAANVPMSQLSTAFRMLAEHIEMAAEGNARQIELFDKLGVSVRDAAGNIKATEVVFGEIADRIRATENPTLRAALAIETFGRSGHLMLPFLQQGAAGIKELGNEAEKAGMIMSKEVVSSLNMMGREMQALSTVMTNAAGTMLSTFSETIPEIVQFVSKYADSISATIGATEVLFHRFTEGFKFLVATAKGVLGLLNDVFSKIVSEAFGMFGPIMKDWLDILLEFGAIKPETFNKIAAGIDKIAAAGNKINLKESFAETKTQIIIAAQDMEHSLDELDAKTQKNTSELTASIKTKAAALLAFFDGIKKTNTEVKDSTGQSIRDMKAMSETITGGLQLAMEDITKRTADWRKAWTNMFDGIEKGITSALDTFILKGGKMKDLMKDIFTSIEESFVHMLTSMLTQALLKEFLGLIMGNGAGGMTGGGVLGNSVASIDQRFGGSSTTGVNSNNGTGGIFGIGSLGGIGGTYLLGGPKEIMETGENGELIGTGTFGTESGLTIGGAMAGIGGTLAGLSMMQQAQSTSGGNRVNIGRSVGGGALSGMAMGATIGSVIPGIGTVIGGVVGAIGGAVMGYVGGKSAKKKQQKAEEEAQQAQEEQEAALRAQARQLIIGDIRAKYGGGLADVSAVTDIGAIMSNGISDATLDQFGGAANVMAQSGAMGQSINNIQVSSPITVNATLAGSYDTQVLAQDLGIQLAASIRAASSGAGP